MSSVSSLDLGPLYQTSVIRQCENDAIQSGVSSATMMERAGGAAFDTLQSTWPTATTLIVCCGKGNNAGDGYVLARLAHAAGMSVTCITLCAPAALKSTQAHDAAQAAIKAGVTCLDYSDEIQIKADVVVDALLGIGLKGDVLGDFDHIITKINASNCPVLALDIPSGLHSDTGTVMGNAVAADYTVTFIAPKVGLFLHQAAGYSGEVICNDLSLPLPADVAQAATLLSSEVPTMPVRDRHSHKGSFGHVLVIGGDYGMGGAVRLAAEAALRVGAGKVSIATRPEHVTAVNASRPEIMCHEVREADDLMPLLERANVVVIGPGLGKTPWAQALLDCVLESRKPMLLDADALNLLANNPQQSDHWVLTPHPGEAGRLLNEKCKSLQTDRIKHILRLQQHYGGVCVLKGAGSLVCDPSSSISLCNAGNPGMATGGMGDVLSGIIGGLIAQGLSLSDAARLGVWVHAIAGDLAARSGGERGLLPTDLFPYLRECIND